MRTIVLVGISVAIGLAILYLQWQQRKRFIELLEQKREENIPRQFFLDENERLHRKIETAYDRVHEQYRQVLITLDNLPIYDENIRSYHGEDLILDDHDESESKKESIISRHSLENEMVSSIQSLNKSTSIKNDSRNLSLREDTAPVELQEKSLSNHQFVELSMTTSTMNYPRLPELKSLCKERGLLISGNKKELINRLLESGYTF